MPGFIGFPEILLLGLVVLLVFGPKRLPEMGRSLGKGMREFKDSITGDHKDEHHLDALVVPTEDGQPPMLGEVTVHEPRSIVLERHEVA
jgi:sec-independent protein translocase protein TatA